MPHLHRQFADKRIVVMSAPNGARRTVSDHPAIPLTPDQLAGEAKSLLDASVSVLHLHVRDGQGGHTLSVDAYRAAIDAIRTRVRTQLIIQVTTESVGIYQHAQQIAVIRELRPEAVSLALRELCPAEEPDSSTVKFFRWLVSERIWPQYIVYSADELRRFDSLRKRGVFALHRPFCLLVLGRYAAQRTGDVAELQTMLTAVDCSEFPWAVCCFGRQEYAAALAAADAGGHARIGFENNLCLADGRIAADNVELIRQFTDHYSARRPATADEIRQSFMEWD